ncbi:MAG: peptidyl-prolyl cis-trans isomerase, partial [Gemmatimonadales bacterium]
MMRTMRANAKWVFYILAFSFIGWLAYGQVMDILGPGANVVLKVNGHEVQIPEYQQAVQRAYEQYRQRRGAAPLTREEERQLQDQVVEQLIQAALLQDEYRRLGIAATNEEVIAMARSQPPPEVFQLPDFQTDGQFDIAKYQRFLATADPTFLQSLEARYREQIPQVKLAQYVTADVYLPDAKLWQLYRDEHDSVRVAVATFWPQQVADADAPVTDAEVERYYEDHRDEYRRPAVAFVSYVALDRRPNAADTAAALARARRLRAEIGPGADSTKFAEVARRESADSGSAAQGGDLGWFKRSQPGFDPGFLAGLRGLGPRQVSPPVLSSFGYHLIRIEQTRGDSVRARHILIPIELVGAHLDAVEARADSLDRLGSEQTDPAALDSAARRLGPPLERGRVVEGERAFLGGRIVPDVSVWAFEAGSGETSPVIEAPAAYYVFRLDSLVPAGVPPLAEVRPTVLQAARLERKAAIVRPRAEGFVRQLRLGEALATAAARHGVPVQTLGPFSRGAPAGFLVGQPLVVGAAFGLRVGERSPAIHGDGGSFVVEVLSRRSADSAAWLAQRAAQRERLLGQLRQARINAYLSGLRAQARIVDRRRE